MSDVVPLADHLVLDLSRAVAGPQVGMMLGDLGARVIKVEPPEGDPSRTWGPPFLEEGDYTEASYYLSVNRNKESIVLDLRTDRDKRVLEQLIRRADVLIENFRHGVMDRLGFGWEAVHELNPRLVQLSITGFGHDGPEGHRAGYDQILQGEAGLMSLTGPDGGGPTKVGVPIADLLAGLNGVYGVLAALLERHRTGRGIQVRTSLLAAVVGAHAFQGTRWTVGGEVPGVSGVHHPSIAPYGLFRTGNGDIQIACGSQRLWGKLAPALGLDADDPRFSTNELRVANRDALHTEMESLLAAFPAEHWLQVIDEIGVPSGKVRTLQEVYEWEQTRSQGLVTTVQHPLFGDMALPGSTVRFGDNSYSGSSPQSEAPPMLNEDGDRIRRWLQESDVG